MSKNKGQKSRAADVVIQIAVILATLMLMVLMIFNAPIISYKAADDSVTQLSIIDYFKNKTPVKYIEGEIIRQDPADVDYRDDVDRNFDDLLDLNQTIEGQFTILFLGFDSRTNGSGNLHDVNYLMQFNLHTASLNILQIPRDTFMPDYAQYTGAPTYKFNSIYMCGDPEKSRIQRVVDAVQESFGVPVDAYLTTTCDNVAEIVDIVGGVPINMPYTLVFEADKIIYEGEQTLNGQQSEWLLRFRHGYEFADIGRVQAQRLFLAAAMKKAISMSSLQIINATNKIYDAELIGTDMSLADISRLADLAATISMDNVHVFMLPGESAKINGQDMWSVHKRAALDIVNENFRTQQKPLRIDQSTLCEFIPEGSYRNTQFDDTAASLQDVDDGTVDAPKLTNKYQNTYIN